MRSFLLSLVLGVVALGLVGLTPGQAEAGYRLRVRYYGTYSTYSYPVYRTYYPGVRYYSPGYLYYSAPAVRYHVYPSYPTYYYSGYHFPW